jgi:hypothetical protein
MAMLLPNVGNAQVFQFRTPPPDVSAAAADWQINSVPIIVGGLTYYATRANDEAFSSQLSVISRIATGIAEGRELVADS